MEKFRGGMFPLILFHHLECIGQANTRNFGAAHISIISMPLRL